MALLQILKDFDRSNIPWIMKSKSFYPKVKGYRNFHQNI